MTKRKDWDAEIKRLERNTKNKIRRFTRTNNVGIPESSNPLMPRDHVSRMSYNEQRAYARRLQSFNSRKNRLLRDRNKRLHNPNEWQMYKAAEAIGNKAVRADRAKAAKYKDMFGSSLIHSMAMKEQPGVGRMVQNPSGSAMHEVHRKPHQLHAGVPLRREAAKQRDKASPTYIARRVAMGREQARQMITEMGDNELQAEVDSLSDHQFHILWNYTHFANKLGTGYAAALALNTGRRLAMFETAQTNAQARAHSLVSWASSLT